MINFGTPVARESAYMTSFYVVLFLIFAVVLPGCGDYKYQPWFVPEKKKKDNKQQQGSPATPSSNPAPTNNAAQKKNAHKQPRRNSNDINQQLAKAAEDGNQEQFIDLLLNGANPNIALKYATENSYEKAVYVLNELLSGKSLDTEESKVTKDKKEDNEALGTEEIPLIEPKPVDRPLISSKASENKDLVSENAVCNTQIGDEFSNDDLRILDLDYEKLIKHIGSEITPKHALAISQVSEIQDLSMDEELIQNLMNQFKYLKFEQEKHITDCTKLSDRADRLYKNSNTNTTQLKFLKNRYLNLKLILENQLSETIKFIESHQ